jgi:hypothetical protein
MRHKNSGKMLYLILVVAILISSCGKSIRTTDNPSKEAEATESTEEMESIPSANTTPKPTAIKPTNKPVPSCTPTPFVLPSSTPTPTPLPLYKCSYDMSILLQDVSASDAQGRVLSLEKGQVIGIFNIYENRIDDTSRFYLDSEDSFGVTEETQVFFEHSIGKYGVHCFSEIPEHLLFGTSEIIASEKKDVVEVESWVQEIKLSLNLRYVMRIDWDGDGIVDELSFEPTEQAWGIHMGTFLFKNGADGSSVRKEMEPMAIDDDSGIDVYADTLLLMQRPNGEYIVVVCGDINSFLEGSGPEGSAVFMFDSELGLTMKKIEQVIEYEDGELYISGDGSFFGWNWMTKTSARMNNNLSFEVLSGTAYYLNSWCGFTYTLQDVNIEIEGTSGYTPAMLSSGMVVIPEKQVLDSEGKGYLYVRLADGSSARIKAEYRYESGNRVALLDGKPDSELFFYIVGS